MHSVTSSHPNKAGWFAITAQCWGCATQQRSAEAVGCAAGRRRTC
jgi:hypothetical protein